MAGTLEEMSAHRIQAMIAAQPLVLVERCQQIEPRVGIDQRLAVERGCGDDWRLVRNHGQCLA